MHTQQTDSYSDASSPRKRLVDAAVTLVSGGTAMRAPAAQQPRRRATRAEAFGAEAIGIRAVAEVAGLTHAAPLHHFPDRVALLAAVAAEGNRQLADAMSGAYHTTPSELTGERLHALVRAQALWAAEHRGLWDVMCSPQLHLETAAVWQGRRTGQSASDALGTLLSPAPASPKALLRRGDAFDELVNAKLRIAELFRIAVEAIPEERLVTGRASSEQRRRLVNAITAVADGLALQFVGEHAADAQALTQYARDAVDVVLAGVIQADAGY